MEVRSIEAIVRALNEAQVQYLIVEGVAVIAHGYERLTNDIDFVIGLEPSNIRRGLVALTSVGYAMRIPISIEEFCDAAVREQWRAEKGMLVLQLWSDAHRRTPVDVFIYEPFDFATEHAAALQFEMGEVIAPIIRYEALVAMKQAAGRLRDLADLEDLARIQKLKEEGL